MPPQEPKSEQLLAAVESRLKGIKSGTTYWSTPGEVERDWKNFDEVKSFPFYGVIEGPREGQELAFDQVEETLTVIIVGWVRDQQQRRVALNRAIADIETAIVSDEEWGGLAVNTKPVSVITDEAALVAKPFAYFELTMKIQYHRPRAGI